jgi:hypothetical protein
MEGGQPVGPSVYINHHCVLPVSSLSHGALTYRNISAGRVTLLIHQSQTFATDQTVKKQVFPYTLHCTSNCIDD